MEVMDMGGPWVGLGGRSPWALGNRQLRGVGRQGSREEVLVQEGLGAASKAKQKEISHLPVPASALFPVREDLSTALLRLAPTASLSVHHLNTVPEAGRTKNLPS